MSFTRSKVFDPKFEFIFMPQNIAIMLSEEIVGSGESPEESIEDFVSSIEEFSSYIRSDRKRFKEEMLKKFKETCGARGKMILEHSGGIDAIDK